PEDVGEGLKCRHCGSPIQVGRTEKMSKSKKNVVEPDTLVRQYGADTVRLFCLFASPPEKDLEWSEQGVDGSFRFVTRVWRLVEDWAEALRSAERPGPGDALPDDLRAIRRKTHATIKKVTEDIENRFHFNTAISAVMELVNALYAAEEKKEKAGPQLPGVMREAVETVVILLSPFVPHVAEELWETLGHQESVNQIAWPGYESDLIREEEFTFVVQVNGKLRGRITVAAGASEQEIKEAVMASPRIQEVLQGQKVKKVILVPRKLVNLVV
ncbi:MAG TPA: class I tRNA ligase family protein, partial [Thermodesulfobacteriota bacterium]|nr:class I tRNA ligase family protein [Thermodesulfobacteriota bacterium]